MINICVPKTHGGAVFTNALKNHYGTIDNPGRMHANNCSNPGIAEVNAIPIIRKKQKLVVSDALLMVIDAGPRWDRRFIRPFGGILIGIFTYLAISYRVKNEEMLFLLKMVRRKK